MSTPSRSASTRASALGRTLKPITSASEADARLTSFSVIPPTPVWITLTRTSECWILPSSPSRASTDPWTSALRTMLRSWTTPSCIWLKRLSSETPRLERCASCSRRSRSARFFAGSFPLRPGSTTPAGPPAPLLREILRLTLVLDDPRELAGRRRAVEAENLDRLSRTSLLDLLTLVVVKRTHLAGRIARDDRVADAQGAAVDEHRRDRATADVEAGLDD